MQKRLTFLVMLFACTLARSQTPAIDSLLKVVARHSHDTIEIKALNYLSSEVSRRDAALATQYTYQHIALAKSLHTDFGLAPGYAWLVTRNQNLGRLDSSMHYLDMLEALVKKHPDDYKAAGNYYNAAGLFYRHQREFTKALPYLIEALKWTKLSKDKTSEAGQLLNIGNTYQIIGDIKNAATYHLQSLVLFEEVKNKRGQSFCLTSLGNDYYSLKQFKAAEKYFLQSIKLKEELQDKRGMTSSWQNLGAMYLEMNKFELAHKYTLMALERSRETNMMPVEAAILVNLARLYRDTKKIEEARKTFDLALSLARKSADSVLVSTIKSDLALMENNLKGEEKILIEHVYVSMEKGDKPTTADAYYNLAMWYARHNNYEKAFENLSLYQQLSDTVRGSAIQIQFKNLEEAYKSEKKEKEIALLKKDQELQSLALSRHELINTSIGIALFSVIIISFLSINRYRVLNKAKRLVEIERVRNNIARDLHDDIGSTLSSINILSQVALQEKNGGTQNYLQRIGDQSARIMENMSDMVWSINPSNDSLSQVVIKMREFATEILEAQNIDFRFSEKVSTNLIIDAEKRKSLFLIFKETINNAAKYSQASLVEISLDEKNHTLAMKIKDNGTGFEEQAVKKGNGLRNLRERAKAVNGTLTLKSSPGQGTEMNLLLPLT